LSVLLVTETVYVALGSNIGQRAAFLERARSAISLLLNVRLLAVSSVEETAPFGAGAQGPYLNQMLAISTTLAPHQLLRALQAIERSLGRVRTVRWGSRTLDLDIVRFGRREMTSRSLVLPHPGLASRLFWQRELAQLELALSA
jgi:2-amino-4-hydroxy-6-hydroxymethyldihydropteridine diphosphokinase